MNPFLFVLRVLSCIALLALLCTVQAAQPLRMVYFQDFPPYSAGAGTQVKGMFIDILNEALVKRMGLTVTHEGLPWARAQLMVKNGGADGFLTLVTDDRKAYAQASNAPTYTTYTYLWTVADHPKREELLRLKSISEATNFTFAYYQGSSRSDSELQGMSVVRVGSIEQSVKMLVSRRVDMIFGHEAVLKGELDKLNLPMASLVRLSPKFGISEFFFQMSQKSDYVVNLPAFNKTLQAMRDDGTLDRLISRYIR